MITVGAALGLLTVAIIFVCVWQHYRAKYRAEGYDMGFQVGWKMARSTDAEHPPGHNPGPPGVF